jgi:hypothetical protein
MKREFLPVIIVISMLAYSCGGSRQASISKDEKVEVADKFDEPDPIRESLFDAKDRTISEENIQRLLSGKLKLPDTVRIALYQYSRAPRNRYYYGSYTDEDYLKAQQNFVDTLISTISKSSKVHKVFLIPRP